MKRVLTAVVLIPIVLLIVFRAPGWLFAAVLGVVALLATWEYLDIAAGYPARPMRLPTLTIVTILFATSVVEEMTAYSGMANIFVFALVTVFAPFVFLAIGMRRDNLQEGLVASAISFLAFPYIGLSLWSLLLLRAIGWQFVLFLLAVVWVGDTCAYYAGRSFGRHKMAPQVSPGKTWEGAIASVIGSVVVGVFVIRFSSDVGWYLRDASLLARGQRPVLNLNLWIACVIALAVNIAAQLGDLIESLIKRGANVKDSGSLLPGHGGILDRIDALLFAAPVATLLFGAAYMLRVIYVG